MDYGKYVFDGERKYRTGLIDCGEYRGVKDREEAAERLSENIKSMDLLAEALSADGSKGLVVIIQAMDAAGKDGLISHVFSGVNPAVVQVESFKQPSAVDLAHDYLWRVHKKIGPRGKISILNRSHYEDVLIGKVEDLPGKQNLPKSALVNIWKKRYRQINDFERYLTENGYAIVKIHLCISKEEQCERLLARMDEPDKNRKYSHGDILNRWAWDKYMKAYTDCINNTATGFAPWYVVPADKKWYARYAASEILLDVLKKLKPEYPELSEEEREFMEADREQLLSEKEKD